MCTIFTSENCMFSTIDILFLEIKKKLIKKLILCGFSLFKVHGKFIYQCIFNLVICNQSS